MTAKLHPAESVSGMSEHQPHQMPAFFCVALLLHLGPGMLQLETLWYLKCFFLPLVSSTASMCQVYWCSGVEQCLAAPSPSAALAQYLLTCTAQLGALTRLVRGSLPDLHRRTLAALITIDVHARDIVDNLIRSDVCIAVLLLSIMCGIHCITSSSFDIWC